MFIDEWENLYLPPMNLACGAQVQFQSGRYLGPGQADGPMKQLGPLSNPTRSTSSKAKGHATSNTFAIRMNNQAIRDPSFFIVR